MSPEVGAGGLIGNLEEKLDVDQVDIAEEPGHGILGGGKGVVITGQVG